MVSKEENLKVLIVYRLPLLFVARATISRYNQLLDSCHYPLGA